MVKVFLLGIIPALTGTLILVLLIVGIAYSFGRKRPNGNQ